jgi:hypothetical protein
MGSIVRRAESSLAQSGGSNGGIQQRDEYRPAVSRRGDGFSVTSQVNLGINPRVLLAWNVRPDWFAQGYKLLGFRSTTGFAPTDRPEDLTAHGQMFLEEAANGSVEQALPEGTYYYTFLLFRMGFFKFKRWLSDPLRFSETISSAKTAIGRIEDHIKLEQLGEQHELNVVKNQVARNEAIIALHRSNQDLAAITKPPADDSLEEEVRREVESIVKKKLKKTMTKVELLGAMEDVKKRLKRIPGWRKLDKAKRDEFLQEIVADLDDEEEFLQP